MKKANYKALLPIGVFLVLYLGLGIPMGFYNIPIVVIPGNHTLRCPDAGGSVGGSRAGLQCIGVPDYTQSDLSAYASYQCGVVYVCVVTDQPEKIFG